MAGMVKEDSRSSRGGYVFLNILNDLIAHYGSEHQVRKLSNVSWTSVVMLKVDHRVSQSTMQKLMNLHTKMRNEKMWLKDAA